MRSRSIWRARSRTPSRPPAQRIGRALSSSGAGKSFSAGYDLGTGSYGSRSSDENAKYLRELSRQWGTGVPLLDTRDRTGARLLSGRGTDLAGHCDITVVADDATIGVPAVRSMGWRFPRCGSTTLGPSGPSGYF